MQISSLTLSPRAFSMGALLGTSGTPELFKRMNAEAGNLAASYFGSDRDPLQSGYQNFMSAIVNPIREIRDKFQQANLAVARDDRFISIKTVDSLYQGVPPCMWQSILTYKPIRDLLKENRIDGWGLTNDDLPEEDCYGRLINNGRAEFSPNSPDLDKETNAFVFEWTVTTEDPDLEFDNLDAIEDTRLFIGEFLTDPETSHLDPTDLPNLRG